jgi:hypothetical protein
MIGRLLFQGSFLVGRSLLLLFSRHLYPSLWPQPAALTAPPLQKSVVRKLWCHEYLWGSVADIMVSIDSQNMMNDDER